MRSQEFLKNLVFHETYNDAGWVDAGICALEINSNSGFKRSCGILLFKH